MATKEEKKPIRTPLRDLCTGCGESRYMHENGKGCRKFQEGKHVYLEGGKHVER